MIHIVTDYRGTYHYLVDRLQGEGAQLIELDPNRRLDRTISKVGILRQLMTLRLLRLRRRWSRDDAVLVISWYLLPILVLIRLRVLRRPARLVSMAVFVHDHRLRVVVNRLLRALRIADLEFIVFSEAERRNLVEVVGVRGARVHRVVYRGNALEPVRVHGSGGGYVFTGGYSNRDYKTFFAAVRGLPYEVVAVASALNVLDDAPPNVDVRMDIPWDQFQELIGRCAVLVLPLREGGEACGQNVLFRGIQQNRPVIATRHDALIDYLGDDYPGFVPPRDPVALAAAIERALTDEHFRAALFERVAAAARWFREQEQVEAEIARILSV